MVAKTNSWFMARRLYYPNIYNILYCFYIYIYLRRSPIFIGLISLKELLFEVIPNICNIYIYIILILGMITIYELGKPM